MLGVVIELMKRQLAASGAALEYVKIRPCWLFNDDIDPGGLVVILLGEL